MAGINLASDIFRIVFELVPAQKIPYFLTLEVFGLLKKIDFPFPGGSGHSN